MQYAMLSELGGRPINEDYVGNVISGAETGCFVLCDGLGGHGHGEVASKFVTDSILGEYKIKGNSSDFIRDAVTVAQDGLLRLQKEKHTQSEMKTTVVVLKVMNDKVEWSHIGDSRLYYFEKKKVAERNLDHSVPQILVAAGEIKEKDIRHHPDRNRLLKVMGAPWSEKEPFRIEVKERTDKQAFLLCSDGFWELIDEKYMQKYLKKAKTPMEWLNLMTKMVLKNGQDTEMDNYSAIAVWL